MAHKAALSAGESSDVTQAGVGTAHLSVSEEDDDYVTVHGVALGAGDVTIGASGTKKKWPGEELEDAAETLEGKPVVRDHENNTSGTVGEVVSAHYREGVGVLYEAKIASHYDELIQDIEAGLLEVSARAYHKETEELEEDDETGALLTENIYFDNLSVVSQGASPSNSLQPGEATAMAQGPGGSAVAVMEQGSPRMDAAELAEAFGVESDADDELAYHDQDEIGDLVEWSDQMGIVVGVRIEDNVHKYDVTHVSIEGDEVVVEDETSTVVAESTDCVYRHDLRKKMDGDDEMSVPDDEAEELASISGLDVNGLAMWDGQMGAIAGFEESDGSMMVELDVLEKEDGQFSKTGETVSKAIHEVDSADMSATIPTGSSVEELESAWHTPDWDGLDPEREWSKPSMEDFDTDDLGEIDDHFFVSKTGEWPPENYGDLALPCVWPNGDLSLDGLDSVHQMASQTDGVSDDMAESIKSKVDGLAQEHFDESVSGEEMESSEPNSTTIDVASLTDDDPVTTSDTASTDGVATAYDITETTMTHEIRYDEASDDDLDDMDNPVVLEKDDVESLREKAEQADSVDEHLEDVNSTLDDLAEAREELEQIDDEILDDVKETDDPVVLESEEHDELRSLVEDVGGVFAEELAEYSPFEVEELQSKFTPTELREKVEEHEEASIEEELNESTEDPDPDGGSVSEDELNEPDGDDPSEEDLREKIASGMEADMPRQAEKVRSGAIGLDELGVDVEQFE